MAIEWVAISAAVIPFLRKYASDWAVKLATKSADSALEKLYRCVIPDEKLVKINEAFVSRFSKELDSAMDLPTLTADAYRDALKEFLLNPSVQDALQAPLDGESELDWDQLCRFWSGFRFITLPEDFDWARVARTYGQSIQRLMLTDHELRPVLAAMAGIRTAEATERSAVTLNRLAGPARAFDLTRYAEAVKTAFAHLKLGPLDVDWAA